MNKNAEDLGAIDTRILNQEERILIPAAPRLEPGEIVYRGRIISAEEKPKPAASVKGVRTYNHNRYTLTGLKRLESLVAGKEEKAHHECEECDAVFEKYRSLQVRGI